MSVKVDSTLAIEANVAKYGTLVTAPREHRKRDRYGDIDPNLTHIDVYFKLASCCARLGKDGGAITVAIIVDDSNGIIQIICLQYN